MVQLHCLGGFHEVGRNAVLVESKGTNIMMDYGFAVEKAEAPILPKEKVDACFITHGHLDHLGMSPMLYHRKKNFTFATAPTFDLSQLLLRDSLKVAQLRGIQKRFTPVDIQEMFKASKIIESYADVVKVNNVKVEAWDAGHTPGSCMFLINVDGKKIMYTGDFKIEPTILSHGARFDVKDVDVLIMETTYSTRDHPPRVEVEKDLIREVKGTLDNGGTAVLPSFAVRAPEILTVLDKLKENVPIYVDGMARDALTIMLKYPEFTRNYKALKKASERVIPLYSTEERENAVKEQCVIVSTGGCLEGGPIVQYLKHFYAKPECSLILTGFQIPGTAGRYLVDTGRFVHGTMDLKLKMKLVQLDMSGHAGRNELLNFVQKIQPSKVITMHGEYCEKFATELSGRGFPAVAPKAGDVLKV